MLMFKHLSEKYIQSHPRLLCKVGCISEREACPFSLSEIPSTVAHFKQTLFSKTQPFLSKCKILQQSLRQLSCVDDACKCVAEAGKLFYAPCWGMGIKRHGSSTSVLQLNLHQVLVVL